MDGHAFISPSPSNRHLPTIGGSQLSISLGKIHIPEWDSHDSGVDYIQVNPCSDSGLTH